MERRTISRRGLLGGMAALGLGAAAAAVSATPAAASPARSIWVFGDSIVAGTWLALPTDPWPARLNARLVGDQAAPVVTNFGVGGSTVMPYAGSTVPCLGTYVPETIAAQSTSPDLVILSAGINDMIRTDDMGSLAWAMYELFGAAYAAGGNCNVLWTTVHPVCAGSGMPASWVPNMTDRIETINSWLRAEYSTDLIDFWDAEAATDGSGNADPIYKYDGLHPNQWGAVRCADLVDLSMLTTQ